MKQLVAVLVLWPCVALADETNNLWIMWERVQSGQCDDPPCDPVQDLRSHFLMNVPPADASSFFNGMSETAQIYGSANLTHESLPICWDTPKTEAEYAPPNILDMEYTDKLSTLRGLPAVYVDLRGVRGPAEFKGQFGKEAQDFVEEEFRKAGISILNKDQLAQTPGRPILGMRYTPEVNGCRPWSISMSLKQDLLLARDLNQMLSSTTWSGSSRQSESDPDFMPRDAMQTVIQQFVQAFVEAQKPPKPEEG